MRISFVCCFSSALSSSCDSCDCGSVSSTGFARLLARALLLVAAVSWSGLERFCAPPAAHAPLALDVCLGAGCGLGTSAAASVLCALEVARGLWPKGWHVEASAAGKRLCALPCACTTIDNIRTNVLEMSSFQKLAT
jgi:hypothetical protein